MIRWEVAPSNHDHPYRFANMYCADGFTKSERGVGVILSHFLSAVIGRSWSEVDVTNYGIEATWVCIDWWYPEKSRSKERNLMPQATLIWTTEYSPVQTRTPQPKKLNDVWNFSLAIANPENSTYYTDDRQVYAHRLLHTCHKTWVEMWRLTEEVLDMRLRRWPVKYWIHGTPEMVYEIAEDWTLRLVSGHPPVDENIAMAQPPFRGQKGGHPTKRGSS